MDILRGRLCNLNSLAIGLLAFGCTCGMGKIITLAFVVFLVDLFVNKNTYRIKACLTQKVVITTCLIFLFFAGTYAVAAIAMDSKLGIHQAGHFLERTLPFFLITILTFEKKDVLRPWLLGMATGTFVVLFSIFSSMAEGFLYRPTSLMGKPNSLGGWAILVFPFLTAIFMHYKKQKKLRILAGTSCLAVLLSLALSLSRGAVLGLVVMVGVGLTIYYTRSYKMVALAMVTTMLLSFGFYKEGNFAQRPYDYERVLLLKSGIAMFKDHPWFGVGLGNFGPLYKNKYISAQAKEPDIKTPHNFLLHYLDMSGLVGTSGLVVLLGSQIVFLVKHTFNRGKINLWMVASFLSLVGLMVHGMVDIIIFNRTHMMLWSAFWGITCWLLNKDEDKL